LAATGLAATVAWLVGAAISPGGAALGWLVAWTTAADLLLGALGLVLLAHVAPIRWMTPLRPALSAVSASWGLLALLFVPVIAGMESLYPWAGAAPELVEHERAMLDAKRVWFAPAAWTVRAALLLLTWAALGAWLRRLEARGDDASLLRARRVAAGGLVALGVAWTVASVDWWMGLDPVWFSSIVGMQRFCGAMTGGVALAVLVAR